MALRETGPLRSMTAGINLKPEHYSDALKTRARGLWFEVHTENYFVDGGPRKNYLRQISENFKLSLHGVGASLGGPELPSQEHLDQVKALVDEFNPVLVSEHATWSSYQNNYFADLLPLPKTQSALNQLVNGIDAYQSAINRQILIENPTNYLPFVSDLDEPEFLVSAARQTGCGLLLDLNNLYLSHQNCGLDIEDYLNVLPAPLVGEIHIAGFKLDDNFGDQGLYIDSHSADVSHEVWQLLEKALKKFNVPVLLERDADVPAFSDLMSERNIAHQKILNVQGREND